MYLCIIRKVHPFLPRKEASFCLSKIRNHYTEYYSVVVMASPAEAVQSYFGKNSIERRRRKYTRGVHAPLGNVEIWLLENAHFAHSQRNVSKK